jgi:hypothetical protein
MVLGLGIHPIGFVVSREPELPQFIHAAIRSPAACSARSLPNSTAQQLEASARQGKHVHSTGDGRCPGASAADTTSALTRWPTSREPRASGVFSRRGQRTPRAELGVGPELSIRQRPGGCGGGRYLLPDAGLTMTLDQGACADTPFSKAPGGVIREPVDREAG